MPFLQLTLPVGSADPTPFEDALLAAGASSITLEDAGDDPPILVALGFALEAVVAALRDLLC